MSALISTMTQKGQVTIPKNVREILHLVTGDKIEFVLNDRDEFVIKPVTRKASEVAGILSRYKKSKPVSVEEMNDGIAEHLRSENF